MKSINEKIEKFYKEMQNDYNFHESIVQANEKYILEKNKETLRNKILKEVVLPKSKTLKYEFSLDDLIKYEDEATNLNKKIDEEEMKNISGGILRKEKFVCLTLTLKNFKLM